MALGPVAANLEQATRAGEFVAMARFICLGKGSFAEAHAEAQAARASPRVVAALKSAVAAGSFASGNWGEQLGDYDLMVASFLGSIRHAGAFDAMLPAMRRVPLRTRIGLVSVGATAARVPTSHVTPISSITFGANGNLDEHMAIAILTAAAELVRAAGTAGNDLFATELRKAIAVTTDRVFFDLIKTGADSFTASGPSAFAILSDVTEALASISTGAASKLFICLAPVTCKRWAGKGTVSGSVAFEHLGPGGGKLANVDVIVSDALLPTEAIVLDADQIAAGAGGIELDTARHASLQMESSPDSPPSASTVLRSLWQHDEVGLRALRSFGARRLGDDAVVVISANPDSPPAWG